MNLHGPPFELSWLLRQLAVGKSQDMKLAANFAVARAAFALGLALSLALPFGFGDVSKAGMANSDGIVSRAMKEIT
jgi:hypothetical protein